MTPVSLAQLQRIAPTSPTKFADWVAPLNAAMIEFGITTEQRIEMFLAQIMHESGGLSAMVENLNYKAETLLRVFSSRFDVATAAAYARNPEAIANKVYADRLGNGSPASGDGWKYRGRGPIQLTGKANYAAASKALGINAVDNPDSLLLPINAARSAAWFWRAHGLNEVADTGVFAKTTKVINGGDIGGKERIGLWEVTKRVIV
jgi:putative chitinase